MHGCMATGSPWSRRHSARLAISGLSEKSLHAVNQQSPDSSQQPLSDHILSSDRVRQSPAQQVGLHHSGSHNTRQPSGARHVSGASSSSKVVRFSDSILNLLQAGTTTVEEQVIAELSGADPEADAQATGKLQQPVRQTRSQTAQVSAPAEQLGSHSHRRAPSASLPEIAQPNSGSPPQQISTVTRPQAGGSTAKDGAFAADAPTENTLSPRQTRSGLRNAPLYAANTVADTSVTADAVPAGSQQAADEHQNHTQLLSSNQSGQGVNLDAVSDATAGMRGPTHSWHKAPIESGRPATDSSCHKNKTVRR